MVAERRSRNKCFGLLPRRLRGACLLQFQAAARFDWLPAPWLSGHKAEEQRRMTTKLHKLTASLGKSATFCALAFLASGEMINTAVAGARITITYDEVKTEVAPQQKTFRTSENRVYTLHGKNQVDFSGSGGFKTTAGMRIGNDMESETSGGLRFKLTYRILNGVLFVVTDLDSYTTTRKIKTDGKNACVSTLEYKKKAGHEHFEIPALKVTFSDMHAENITCSISETPD
jgi:hypothetical protein